MERMVILVTPEQKQAIAARAQAEKVPMGEMVRRAVDRYEPEEDTAALERLLDLVRESTSAAMAAIEKAERDARDALEYLAAQRRKAA